MQDARDRSGRIMQMKEEARPGLPLVDAYGADGFTIHGRRRAAPLLVTPEGCHGLEAETLAAVDSNDLTPLEAVAPALDLILVGTGRDMQPLPDSLSALLRSLDLASEAMDSAAAARTFNTLLLEDRRVAVLLMPL